MQSNVVFLVVMSTTAKAISTAVAATAAYHFIGDDTWGESVKYGLISGGSVLVTDTVIGWIPSLPRMFSFMSTYAMDGVSSLIAAVVISLMDQYFSGFGFSIGMDLFKDLFKNFLYSLGSTVVGGYGTSFVQGILPAGMQ